MVTHDPRKASFFLRKEIYASTLLSSASESFPHTLDINNSLERMDLGFAIKSFKISNYL